MQRNKEIHENIFSSLLDGWKESSTVISFQLAVWVIDIFLIVTPWSFYSAAASKQGDPRGKVWYFFVSRWSNFAWGTARGWERCNG